MNIVFCLFVDTDAVCRATRSRRSSICSSVTLRLLRRWPTRHRRRLQRLLAACTAGERWSVAGGVMQWPVDQPLVVRSAPCSRVTAACYVITPCPAAATTMTSAPRKWRHRSTPYCSAAAAAVKRCARMFCRRSRTRARRIFHHRSLDASGRSLHHHQHRQS